VLQIARISRQFHGIHIILREQVRTASVHEYHPNQPSIAAFPVFGAADEALVALAFAPLQTAVFSLALSAKS
jgi:hypothetical protein